MKKQFAIIFFALLALSALCTVLGLMFGFNWLKTFSTITFAAAFVAVAIGASRKTFVARKKQKIILSILLIVAVICIIYGDVIHPILFEGHSQGVSLISIFFIAFCFGSLIILLKKNKEKEAQQVQS